MARGIVIALFCLAILLFGSACGDHGDTTEMGASPAPQSILKALPDSDIFRIDLPSAQRARGDLQAKIGEAATFWELSRGAANSANASVHSLIAEMQKLVPFPTLTASEEKTIWQLDQPLDADENAVPQLTIMKQAEDNYSFAYREKSRNGTEWLDVIIGEMNSVDQPEGMGTGSFTIDYTNMAQADPSRGRRGQAEITVSANEGEVRSLKIQYKNYLGENDTSGEVRDMLYEYQYRLNGSGSFDFQSIFNWSGKSEAMETLTVSTLWNSAHNGQSQVVITGEDLEEQGLFFVELRECWDDSFHQSYYVQLYYWKNPPREGNPTRDKEEGNPSSCIAAFEVPEIGE